MSATPQGTIAAEMIVKGIQERKAIGPFHNLVIEGDLDLGSCNHFFPLVFQGCVFKGHLNAAGAMFGKALTLAGCTIEGHANFEGAQVISTAARWMATWTCKGPGWAATCA